MNLQLSKTIADISYILEKKI